MMVSFSLFLFRVFSFHLTGADACAAVPCALAVAVSVTQGDSGVCGRERKEGKSKQGGRGDGRKSPATFGEA